MNLSRERICLYTPAHPTRTSAADIMYCAAELGVGGVELRSFCQELRTPEREVARQLGALARSLGLTIPCFSVASDLWGDGEAAVTHLLAYAEICSELEIPYLHHTVAFDLQAFALSDGEIAVRFERCVTPTLRVCEYANSLGVRTLIEDQGYVFNGADNCRRLCDLSDGRIGIVADLGNILFVDETPADFIRAMGGRVCHAHIKDFERYDTPDQPYKYRSRKGKYLADIEIGTGCIDLDAVKMAFADIGYKGMFALEFSRVADENEARRVLKRLTGEETYEN